MAFLAGRLQASALEVGQPRLLASPFRFPGLARPVTGSTTTSAIRSLSILHRPVSFQSQSSLSSFKHWPSPALSPISLLRRQFLSTGSSSLPPYIARLEFIANSNPKSATAQYALYAACARFGRPDYVVHRYQSNQFASNSSCHKVYLKAVSDMYGSTEVSIPENGLKPDGISPDVLQAVSQAVGSRARSGLSVSGSGNGSRTSPIHVMVEESWFSTIFKVVRFFAIFGFITWASMVTLQLFLEETGIAKRISGQPNAEVRPELQSTRFSDVHGCEEAKEELRELVDFLKAPEKFNALGGKLPKGVLLIGPPGTGKTLLARAVAGEAGVPFFYMSGSEFDEIYVGVGAKRVRELFGAARAKAPAIVFIDELDAIGGKRNERDATYAKQTLNQLLTDLDGFDQTSRVIFIAATNFPEMLDPALTRAGRFDRQVVVPLPDTRGRLAILKHHTRNTKLAPDVDLLAIAQITPQFSGAELQNLINQAAVKASRDNSTAVSKQDLNWARDKVMIGAERRSAVIKLKDQLMTAYHEGGHALASLLTPGSEPLDKVTIVPRANALGITTSRPDPDRVSTGKIEFFASIDMLMGGKVAEELIYGEDFVSSGCASDLREATRIAYMMVAKLGMSNEIGNVDLDTKYDSLSSETREKIWVEVQSILNASYLRVLSALGQHRPQLDAIAKALVEYEHLDGQEVEDLVWRNQMPNKAKVRSEDTPLNVAELILESVSTRSRPTIPPAE